MKLRNLKISFVAPLMLTVLSCGDGTDMLGHTGICDGYAEESTSLYVLPFAVGASYEIGQGNCSAISHFAGQRYSYDILMPIGSSLVAARAGTVLDIEESYSDSDSCPKNNFVHIRHDDGTVAAYLHLTNNGVLVAKGDAVVQGQAIALSGDSGCSTDPHLHFVVFEDDRLQESVPVTFSNSDTPHPRGLQKGKRYTSQ